MNRVADILRKRSLAVVVSVFAIGVGDLFNLGAEKAKAARFDFSTFKYYGTWFYSEDYDPAVRLRVMVSNDALHWWDIETHYVTNNPTGRNGNAMVMWANNKFNLYTCGGPAQTIQTAYSTDGHTYHNYVNPPYNAANRGDFATDNEQTWSGNWFMDRNGHIYIVWSSSRGGMYYIQAKDDADLGASFGDPVRISGGAMTNGIDPTIYDDGAAYYLFYQSFRNGTVDDEHITVLKSTTNPFSGYDTVVKHGNWTGLGQRADSPVPYFSITGNVWMIYDDDWGASGERRVRLQSGDWRLGTDKWSQVEPLTPRSPKIRAGSFIAVPK